MANNRCGPLLSLVQSLYGSPQCPSTRAPRFNRIMVNNPETEGYSVALQAHHTCLLVRHIAGDDESPCAVFLGDTTSWYKSIWLYIPIDCGKLIAEIWRRDCYSVCRDCREDVTLISTTTKGHVYALGKHPTPGYQY